MFSYPLTLFYKQDTCLVETIHFICSDMVVGPQEMLNIRQQLTLNKVFHGHDVQILNNANFYYNFNKYHNGHNWMTGICRYTIDHKTGIIMLQLITACIRSTAYFKTAYNIRQTD